MQTFRQHKPRPHLVSAGPSLRWPCNLNFDLWT